MMNIKSPSAGFHPLFSLAKLLFYCAIYKGLKLRAILQESEAELEMKNFSPPSIFVWR